MINHKNKKINRKIKLFGVIMIMIISIFTIYNSQTYAKILPTQNVESETKPEIKRSIPIIQSTESVTSATAVTSAMEGTQASTVETLGPNLIPNSSFESAGSGGNPMSWNKGGYGTNNRQLTYPVAGNTDTKAVRVIITSYTSGDAKWYFSDIPVTPGKQYQLSNYSLANVQSTVTVRYKMSDGSFVYKDIATINPSTTYQKNTLRITIPTNTVSLTVFHLINRAGTLTTDDYSLNLITPPQSPNNLVTNGDFETIGSNSLPQNWNKGGWGINSKIFTYPTVGTSGGKAAKIEITSHTSGDAKWYFTPINVSPGIYTYSDEVISDVPSVITVQFYHSDGTVSYKDLLYMPTAVSPTSSSVDFSVETEVTKITLFHLIKSPGTLTIDNVSVVKKANPVGVFTTGAITLRFDDGWLSQYQNAIPKIQSVGIKGTFYIVSKQKADDGYPAFMNIAQIKEIYNMGHEIGAHSRTHPYLSQLTATEQQNEILGSRNDLLELNVGPILSFTYPFGDYNATTIGIVKNAGFSSGMSTIDGLANQTSDKYQIQRMGMLVSTSLAEVKQWIDNAQIQKKWLILTFHEVNSSGNQYSVTPEMFNQIIDYIISKNIQVVTTGEGVGSIQ